MGVSKKAQRERLLKAHPAVWTGSLVAKVAQSSKAPIRGGGAAIEPPSLAASRPAKWRDQRDWTAEKYRRFDRGEWTPHDWKQADQHGG